jgi:hypothetical protein
MQGPVAFTGRPAAVAWGRNRLNIFVRGQDGHIYERRWDGQTWQAWRDLGGGFVSDPAAAAYAGLIIGLAAVTDTGDIAYSYSVGDTWAAWQPMKAPASFGPSSSCPAHTPTLIPWNGSWFSLLGVDDQGTAWTNPYDGSTWRGWFQIGEPGAVTSRLAAATWGPQQLALFGTNSPSSTGAVTARVWDGGTWRRNFDALGSRSDFKAEPVAATFRGQTMRVVALGSDGQLYHNVWSPTVNVVDSDAIGVKVPVGDWSDWSNAAPLAGSSFASSPAIFSWVST